MGPPEESNPKLDTDDLEGLRQNLDGTCWWCGKVADSHEHKYKRSDLARILDANGLFWGSDAGGRSIRSIRKSREVRFGRTMCQDCNNARSQPFDRAYDTFSDFVVKMMPHLWSREGLNMVEIFGPDWESQQLNLARYYAKHFGSILVDSGIPAPAGLVEFLDGAAYARDCGMYFVKDEALYLGYKELTKQGFDGIGYWISPGAGILDKSRTRLVGFKVATRIGYVGVLFEWREDSGQTESFMGHVEPVLNELALSEDRRSELNEMFAQKADEQLGEV